MKRILGCIAVLLVLSLALNVYLLTDRAGDSELPEEPAASGTHDDAQIGGDEAAGFAEVNESDSEVAASTSVEPSGAEVDGYTITEAYVYPDRSTEEWKQMTTGERRRACEIPADVIEQMTTQALLESVIWNPFFLDITVYNTLEMGIELSGPNVSGLKELTARPDFLETAEHYIRTVILPDMLTSEDADVREHMYDVYYRIRIVSEAYHLWN